ncbi:MAG: hypothetical protein H6732_15145 [Alphaproteobacteria bacterium]|nr:hypothetical protein [Alphaproteobacteria bacterium]
MPRPILLVVLAALVGMSARAQDSCAPCLRTLAACANGPSEVPCRLSPTAADPVLKALEVALDDPAHTARYWLFEGCTRFEVYGGEAVAACLATAVLASRTPREEAQGVVATCARYADPSAARDRASTPAEAACLAVAAAVAAPLANLPGQVAGACQQARRSWVRPCSAEVACRVLRRGDGEPFCAGAP